MGEGLHFWKRAGEGAASRGPGQPPPPPPTRGASGGGGFPRGAGGLHPGPLRTPPPPNPFPPPGRGPPGRPCSVSRPAACAGLTEELGHDFSAPAQGDALLPGELQRHGQAHRRGARPLADGGRGAPHRSPPLVSKVTTQHAANAAQAQPGPPPSRPPAGEPRRRSGRRGRLFRVLTCCSALWVTSGRGQIDGAEGRE